MSLRVYYEVLNQKGSPALFTDTFANRPAFGFQGRLFMSTDTAQIFEDTGSAWTLLADATGSVSGFVPYTGATTDVNLGSFDLTADLGILNQVKAVGSGGLSINANSGTQIALLGAGGGANMTLYGALSGTTASFSGLTTITGSTTASSGISRGANIISTLIASANGDTLVGLNINPTFTNGAFTGVINLALNVTGQTKLNNNVTFGEEIYGPNNFYINGPTPSTGTIHLRSSILNFSGGSTNSSTGMTVNNGFTLSSSNNSQINITSTVGGVTALNLNRAGSAANWQIENFRITSGALEFKKDATGTAALMLFSSYNVGINQTVDAGYKLDVNGTARVQNKLSVGTPTQATAVMEVTSTTQGFLPPRMTTSEKNAIVTPATGLVIFDTDLAKLCVFATTWQTITSI